MPFVEVIDDAAATVWEHTRHGLQPQKTEAELRDKQAREALLVEPAQVSDTAQVSNSTTELTHKLRTEELRAVARLSKLSYVSEYVEISRGFAPAAGGGEAETYERLNAFLSRHWLRCTSKHAPLGRFSEAEELARAFGRRICAEESAEMLGLVLGGVAERYARAREDEGFWAAFVVHAHRIYHEEEERRVRREVMGWADMEAVLALPSVEDAVEYVELLRCWNGLAGGGGKVEARVEKVKERVSKQWLCHNKDRQPPINGRGGAAELAWAMRRQIIALKTDVATSPFLQNVLAAYPRAEDKQWWDQFLIWVGAIYSAHWSLYMDEEAIFGLPCLEEVLEYLEILRCWLGNAGAAEEKHAGYKSQYARGWLAYNRHTASTTAVPLSDKSEAERLAAALTNRIAACRSSEAVARHIDNVKDGYTREQGDSRWWVLFESAVWKIFLELDHAAAARRERELAACLVDMRKVLDNLPRLIAVREAIRMEWCWRGIGDMLDSRQDILQANEQRWLSANRTRRTAGPVEDLFADMDDAERLATYMKKRFDLCMSCNMHDEHLAILMDGYRRKGVDTEWWIRFWTRISALVSADVQTAKSQAMAATVEKQIQKLKHQAARQAASTEARTSGFVARTAQAKSDLANSKTIDIRAQTAEAGSDDVEHVTLSEDRPDSSAESSATAEFSGMDDSRGPWASKMREGARLAEAFRPKILACKATRDLAVLIGTALASRPEDWHDQAIRWALLHAFLPIWIHDRALDIPDPQRTSNHASENAGKSGNAEMQCEGSDMAALLAVAPPDAPDVVRHFHQQLDAILRGCEVEMAPEVLEQFLGQCIARDVPLEAERVVAPHHFTESTEKPQLASSSEGPEEEYWFADGTVITTRARRDHSTARVVRHHEQDNYPRSETVRGAESRTLDFGSPSEYMWTPDYVSTLSGDPETEDASAHAAANGANTVGDTSESDLEAFASKKRSPAEQRDWDDRFGDSFIAKFFPREAALGLWSFKDVPYPPDEAEFRRIFPGHAAPDAYYERTQISPIRASRNRSSISGKPGSTVLAVDFPQSDTHGQIPLPSIKEQLGDVTRAPLGRPQPVEVGDQLLYPFPPPAESPPAHPCTFWS